MQLSIATLILLQFLYIFPLLSNGALNNIKFGSSPSTWVHYELAITAVNDKALNAPLVVSQDWRMLGVQEYDQLQLLIDNMARALSANDLDKAQEIYTEIENSHLNDLDNFSFEIQHIQVQRAARSHNDSVDSHIINLWTSDQLKDESYLR